MEATRLARSREHWLVLACALALPLALLVLGGLLRPDPRGWGTHEQLGFRPCLPMRKWNFPCPGCGVTTSIALVAHGSLLAALRAQPFGLVAFVTSLAGAAWGLVGHARGRDLRAELPRVVTRRSVSVLATLALLAWIYKIAVVRWPG